MRRHRESIWTNSLLSLAAAVGAGGACAAVCTVLFSAVTYFLLDNMKSAHIFTIISLGLGSFCGAYLCGKYRRRRGLVEGALCGALIYGVIFAVSLGLGGAADIRKLLLTAVCGAVGGVSGVNSKRPKKLMDQ